MKKTMTLLFLIVGLSPSIQGQIDTCKLWTLHFSIDTVHSEHKKEFVYNFNLMSDCYLDAYPAVVHTNTEQSDTNLIRYYYYTLGKSSEPYSYGAYYNTVHSHSLWVEEQLNLDESLFFLVTETQIMPIHLNRQSLDKNPLDTIYYFEDKNMMKIMLDHRWNQGKLLVYDRESPYDDTFITHSIDKTQTLFEIEINPFIFKFSIDELKVIFIEGNEVLYAHPRFLKHPYYYKLDNWDRISIE